MENSYVKQILTDQITSISIDVPTENVPTSYSIQMFGNGGNGAVSRNGFYKKFYSTLISIDVYPVLNGGGGSGGYCKLEVPTTLNTGVKLKTIGFNLLDTNSYMTTFVYSNGVIAQIQTTAGQNAVTIQDNNFYSTVIDGIYSIDNLDSINETAKQKLYEVILSLIIVYISKRLGIPIDADYATRTIYLSPKEGLGGSGGVTYQAMYGSEIDPNPIAQNYYSFFLSDGAKGGNPQQTGHASFTSSGCGIDIKNFTPYGNSPIITFDGLDEQNQGAGHDNFATGYGSGGASVLYNSTDIKKLGGTPGAIFLRTNR